MTEKTPLVNAEGGDGSAGADNRAFSSVAIEPELPDVAIGTGHRTINCQVCHRIISLEGKQNQLVVKCQDCGEATPVKAAPPGKKYVRCPCNCLLICKSGSSRVGCPRDTCKRVITLATPSSSAAGLDAAGGPSRSFYGAAAGSGLNGPGSRLSVTCARCGSPFIITTFAQSSAARCPHCRQVSSVGPRYARLRWIACLLAGIFIAAIGIVLVIETLTAAKKNPGIYAAYVAIFLVALATLMRSAAFCCMPVSNVEIPNQSV